MTQSAEQQDTQRSWSGVAEVIAPDGDIVVEVAAELWERHHNGRGIQWGGHLQAPAHVEAPHLPSAEDNYTLRLIGAGEGLVTTHGPVKMHLFEGVDPTEDVEVIGVGETPF